MNSSRTMPCVLVLPPRSNPPGFHNRRICLPKLSMMESTHASSSGIGRSSAIFKPSSWRCMLISAVVRLARGSRSRASKAGRKNGSNRRSRWTNAVEASLSKLRNAEPVLAFGWGRLVLEPRLGIHHTLREGLTHYGCDGDLCQWEDEEHGKMRNMGR